MNSYKQFLITVFLIETSTHSTTDEWPIKENEYGGENFPDKYMDVENSVSTLKDLNHYLRSLKRTVIYFAKAPNDTDANKAIGLYYMKAILKRTLRDDNGNLKNPHQRIIKNIINKAEYVVSHYVYMNKIYQWNDYEYRLSKLFQSDESQVYSIAKFNRNRLQKWIRSNGKINDFHREFDEASLPKEKYVELALNMDAYYVIDESDKCVSRINFNPEPIDLVKLYPCRHDPVCRKHIYALPSVAYALSHRLLYIMAQRHFRRCFIDSEAEDDTFMDKLCSHMYREAVYIARLGYFSRDMFLEHVALCALIGYEEFHRQKWFKKAASWVDKKGCIYEDRNFLINSSKTIEVDEKYTYKVRQNLEKMLDDKCHNHPMALLVVVLAHAVRYTTTTLIKHNKLNIPHVMNVK